MISQISKMRNSIFTKIILIITALSFVSLFGVSGYIGAAAGNKAVIKVDNLEVSQSEFSYMLQRDISRLKASGAVDFDENGEKKAKIADALLKSQLNDLILDNTMQKYNIDITENLVRLILLQTPQFLNANGQFDREAYNWFLNRSGLTEQELIANIKRSYARRVFFEEPAAYLNVPEVQINQMAKVLGQRRTFRYVKVENAKAAVTREPSKEELDQYYDDMSEELTIPEKRDLSVLYLPQEKLNAGIEIPQEDIDAYYKEHIDEFEQSEQRSVLQMVFADEAKADAAYAALNDGRSFVSVAADNGQSENDINLGDVDKNSVSEELAKVIFSLETGGYSKPEKIGDEWQILQVTDIKPAVNTPREKADAEIIAALRDDRSYDHNYEVISDIEDKVAAGTSLEDLAKAYGAELLKVSGEDEDGNAVSVPEVLKDVIKSRDFIDEAFAYNEGETAQAVETDDGIAVARVDKIAEAHVQPRDKAENKLKDMWLENERAAVTRETADNIEHDLEAGDDLAVAAKRYGLNVISSRPMTRGETFDNISFVEMKNLFALPKNQPKVLNVGDDYLIIETSEIYDDSASITADKREALKQTLYADSVDTAAEMLLKDFASGYKIEVNRNRTGVSDL